MMNGSPNMSLIISTVLFFGLIFFLIVVLMRFLKRDELKVEKRKNKIMQQRRGSSVKDNDADSPKKSGYLDRISKLGVTEVLGNELINAEIMVRPEEFLGIWIVVALCLPLLIMLLMRNVVPGLIILLLCIVAPLLFLKTRKGRKREKFDGQLSDALLTIGNCLSAGLSFQQAMENIAREMPDPIAGEFGRVVKEMRLGKTTEKALTDMMERIPSQDLMIALNAILIQHQVGGNLSEILETIAETIQDRHKIKKDIKVLTAQGRFSGIIIGLLPLFLGLAITFINPTYMMGFITSSLGLPLLGLGVLMEVVGLLLIRKIINIKY